MQSIRNIAIIAHVDHGKTTLVDKIIDQAHILDERKVRTDLLLDNNDLERERGITILSKNVSIIYKGVKINVIDTPGHADFGGEVERVLKMADGVLLLVDAFEGPMPQTRFVLGKALELGLTPIVVINKVDKPNCTPDLVHDKVFDLMFALDATEEQLNFESVYGSAKQGWMSYDWKDETDNIIPLLDSIVKNIPEAPYQEGTPQMQITSLDFTSFVGRIAIGRVFRGDLEEGKDYMLCKADGSFKKVRIKELHTFEGLGKDRAAKVRSGDICAITGIEGFDIGDTIADIENPEALPRLKVDEPTMSMLFTINNSPFYGKEGKYVTSRHLRDRLYKETEKNLALRIEDTDTEDKFNVFGRGILHLSVLIETMRREGYELQVGRPQVLIKDIEGVKSEPYETLVVNVPDESSSKVINLVTMRKGDLLVMEPKGDLQHLEFDIPSRGLIGLRNKLLTATSGEAIINHRLRGFDAFKGDLTDVVNGAIVSSEAGKATA
ncbi:MAG: GTP-binding protein, partial [Lutibacter sp.]|uniref:GTP-binding protein n=1 Tax=Lutibacter sp. TaxID=1925666 RepID=UPI0018504E91